jgi:predicted DNA-binding protein (MmcQ/YjbR family)
MSHENQLDSPGGRRLLAALRKACAHLLEVTEIIDGFGHTTFKVRKKSFLIAGMGEDGTAVSIKSDPTSQAFLIRRGPWYRTPYIGQHGWVSLADPLAHEWAEVALLIEDAYRMVAPRSLVGRL